MIEYLDKFMWFLDAVMPLLLSGCIYMVSRSNAQQWESIVSLSETQEQLIVVINDLVDRENERNTYVEHEHIDRESMH